MENPVAYRPTNIICKITELFIQSQQTARHQNETANTFGMRWTRANCTTQHCDTHWLIGALNQLKPKGICCLHALVCTTYSKHSPLYCVGLSARSHNKSWRITYFTSMGLHENTSGVHQVLQWTEQKSCRTAYYTRHILTQTAAASDWPCMHHIPCDAEWMSFQPDSRE